MREYNRAYIDKLIGRAGVSRQDLEHWLDTPVVLAPDVATKPRDFTAEEALTWKEFLEAYMVLASHRALAARPLRPEELVDGKDKSGSPLDKFIRGAEMDLAEKGAVKSFTREMQVAMPLLKRAAEIPWNDVLLARTCPLRPDEMNGSLEVPMDLSLKYTEILAAEGKESSATEVLAAFARLVSPAPREVILDKREKFFKTVMSVAGRTKDSDRLRELLAIINDPRGIAKAWAATNFHNYDVVTLADMMMEDGYLERRPVTRREYYDVLLRVRDYRGWLERRLGAKHERIGRLYYVYVRDLDVRMPDVLHPVARATRPVFRSVFRWGFDPLTREARAYQFYLECYNGETFWDRYRGRAHRQLLGMVKASLARRIVELESGEVGTPERILARGILAEIPEDTYGAVTGYEGRRERLRFSEERDGFYSVGEDGHPGTKDDLTEWEMIELAARK